MQRDTKRDCKRAKLIGREIKDRIKKKKCAKK